jgi:hypothetical protein
MKNLIYLAAITAIVIAPFAAESAQAQSIFGQSFSGSGYSSTTIYVPSLPQENSYANGTVTTTTIVVPSSPNIYPNYNFPGSNTSYGGNSYRSRRYPQPTVIFTQPTVILTQPNLYPRAIQSSCGTSIIGSPIPSPIAINQSGIPCR